MNALAATAKKKIKYAWSRRRSARIFFVPHSTLPLPWPGWPTALPPPWPGGLALAAAAASLAAAAASLAACRVLRAGCYPLTQNR
jgi:hypothetical protein